jgi:hypothetical protein
MEHGAWSEEQGARSRGSRNRNVSPHAPCSPPRASLVFRMDACKFTLKTENEKYNTSLEGKLFAVALFL